MKPLSLAGVTFALAALLSTSDVKATLVAFLPLDVVIDETTVIVVAKVRKKTTASTQIEEPSALEVVDTGKGVMVKLPVGFPGGATVMTSRYEVEVVRFLQGAYPDEIAVMVYSETLTAASRATAASGIEHQVQEGREYIFFFHSVPSKTGPLEVFRVEPLKREQDIVRAIETKIAPTNTTETTR